MLRIAPSCLPTLILAISALSQAPQPQRDGDVVSATGTTYHATFAPAGLKFHALPAAGEGAPSLGFELLAVERRGRPATGSLAGSQPRIAGQTITYDRPGLVERYEVREDGVEQSFLINHSPPGSGDLVVRGRLVTNLTASQVDSPATELTFAAIDGVSVHIGAVTGFDATGKQVAGSLRYTGTELELVLPAGFVDTAVWPILVDPLIGSRLTPTPSGAGLPDVAYDATNQVYVIVWRQNLTTVGLWRPYYRIVRTDGSYATAALPLMPIPQLVTYTGGTRIRVANINSRDTFVATWDSGSGTSRAIHCGAISASNYAPSMAVVVASGANYQLPDIGGEAVLVDDDVVLIWLHASLGTIRAKQINIPPTTAPATPVPFGSVVTIAGSGAPVSAGPVIARTGGGSGRYLVSWGERSGPFSTFANLRGIVITRNLAAVNSPFTIAPTALSAPRNVALDGNGENWVVAYDQANAAGDRDVMCRRVELPVGTGGLTVHSAVGVATTTLEERRPSVADLGESYLVGYQRDLSPGSSTHLVSLDPTDCTTCEGLFTLESAVLLSANEVRVASSGGASNISAMVVWQAVFGSPLNARAHLFAPRDGLIRNLGGGCGTGGTAVSTCSVAGNANYTQRLIGAAANAATFLVIGLSNAPQACGACSLIPDPASGATLFLGATSASGDASYSMSIPPGPAFVGLQLNEQWITLTAQPRCRTFGFDLSNALSVTIQ